MAPSFHFCLFFSPWSCRFSRKYLSHILSQLKFLLIFFLTPTSPGWPGLCGSSFLCVRLCSFFMLRWCACLTEEKFHYSRLFLMAMSVYSLSMYVPFSGSSHQHSRTGRNGSSVLRGPTEAEQADGSLQSSPPAGFGGRHHRDTLESDQVSGIKHGLKASFMHITA